MCRTDDLVKVGRHGLAIGDTFVPATFFRHGQPGQRFAVYPKEQNMMTCVRRSDLDAICESHATYAKSRGLSVEPRSEPIVARRPCMERLGCRPLRNLGDEAATADIKARTPLEAARRAERELLAANNLAVLLANMKAGMREGFMVNRRRLASLQEKHWKRLQKCLALRSLAETLDSSTAPYIERTGS